MITKIRVMTTDEQIITLDIDRDEAVENVKALLEFESGVALQQQRLLYNGKEMRNHEKLSSLGVVNDDLIMMAKNSSSPSSSSQSDDLRVNPDGSAVNPAAFQQQIRNDSNFMAQNFQNDPDLAQAIFGNDLNKLQEILRHQEREALKRREDEELPELAQTISGNDANKIKEILCQRYPQREELGQDEDEELQCNTNVQNVPRDYDGEISAPFFAGKEIVSCLIDEEKHHDQEAVGENNDVDEEVIIQKNGTSRHAEDNDHDHVFSSCAKQSMTVSIQKVGNSLVDSTLSPSIASPSSANAPQNTKGRGLKKWRRLRREVIKDPLSDLDSTKVLKRGSENISDVKKQNDGSVSSTNAFVKSPGQSGQFSIPAPSLNYKVALDTTFSAGANDSEDRSSKSSTAASTPKHKHDAVKVPGYPREKHKGKYTSTRHLNNTGQRLQPGKGHSQADPSKKPRGESVNVDKENSLSSMESDSRSYTSVLQKGSSDQIQSGRAANFDEQDDYDQEACEVQSSDEFQAGHNKYGDLSPNCSAELSCSTIIGKSKDHRLCEPLLTSILLLQSAQEALEREVQMFKEIGAGVNSLCGDSGKATSGITCSMFDYPKACVDRDCGWDAEFNHDQTVERQLDEAKVRLQKKELKIKELEMVIEGRNMGSFQADGSSIIEMERNRWQEMEAELEGIFKLKLEAEVQYVAMTESAKDLMVLTVGKMKLLRDQTIEASERQQSLRVIADVGNTGSILQGQAQMHNLYTKVTEDEQIHKMKSRMVKFSSYVFMQLFLLVLVLGLFLLRVLPKSATVVPT